ncbi:MAG: hypothetical protein Q9221_002976 [Calogaya cf. arnoldii]
MQETTASVPAAGAEPSVITRTTEMVHLPQSSLQYPSPAALSNPTTNHRTRTPTPTSARTFLNPIPNSSHQTRYSPERVPPSAARSTSGGRRESRNASTHLDRYDDAPITPNNDQPRSSRQHHQPQSNGYSPYDPEKAMHSRHSPPNGHRPAHSHSSYVSEEEEDDIKEHAVWILVRFDSMIPLLRIIISSNNPLNQVYLSFFSPAVASLVSIYSLFTTLFLILLSPITVFVRPRKPLAHQFHTRLTPPINYQLRFVCSTYRSDIHSNINSEEHRRGNPVLLSLINILSPVYAAGIAVTAWVAAGFWFTALILGDPDGRDKKDDGRTVVLGVRRLWERWLIRGLR